MILIIMFKVVCLAGNQPLHMFGSLSFWQIFPEFPFQNVVADLFEIKSYKYLVYADRLTGFVELAYFPSTTISTVIINTLREFFH